MTQHIKTHFKDRGINSLAANGFAQFAKLAGAAGGVGTPEGYRNESGEISRSDHGQEMEDWDKMIDDVMDAGNEGEEEGECEIADGRSKGRCIVRQHSRNIGVLTPTCPR